MTRSPAPDAAETLPPRARLLHVGLPKTGTTFLQQGAAHNRAVLLDHGVRYPGGSTNHRKAVNALTGRGPDRLPWTRVLSEVEADAERRILLSSEFAVLCTDEQAAAFRAELGDRLHVLITLRGYAPLLASSWQQNVKVGARTPFEPWLRQVLAEPPAPGTGALYHQRLDGAGAAARWARLVGPERVLVVLADPQRPTFLPDTVADLLGAPRPALRPAPTGGGFAANRSMSWPEAELVRTLNGIVRTAGRTTWTEYAPLVFNGAIARMLRTRSPGRGEPAVLLPDWAARVAAARAHQQISALSAGGYRILGHLDSLLAPARTGTNGAVDEVPLDAAVEALAGVVSAGTARRGFFGEDPDNAEPCEDGSPRAAALRAAHEASLGSLLAVALLRLARATPPRSAAGRRRLGRLLP